MFQMSRLMVFAFVVVQSPTALSATQNVPLAQPVQPDLSQVKSPDAAPEAHVKQNAPLEHPVQTDLSQVKTPEAAPEAHVLPHVDAKGDAKLAQGAKEMLEKLSRVAEGVRVVLDVDSKGAVKPAHEANEIFDTLSRAAGDGRVLLDVDSEGSVGEVQWTRDEKHMARGEKQEVSSDKETQMVRGEKQEVLSEPQPHMSEKSKADILRNHAATTSSKKDEPGGSLSRVMGLCLGVGMIGGGVWYWRRNQHDESPQQRVFMDSDEHESH